MLPKKHSALVPCIRAVAEWVDPARNIPERAVYGRTLLDSSFRAASARARMGNRDEQRR